MALATCLKKPVVLVSPINTTNTVFIHRKKCLCGAVRSSTMHRGAWKESCPPMHQVIGKQTSVSAVGPAVVHKLSPVHLGHGPGAPDEHCLRQSPMDERAFVEVQASSREVIAHWWKKKNPRWDTLERVRGTVWCYPYHPFPKVAELCAKIDLLSPTRESERVWVSKKFQKSIVLSPY